MGACALVSVHLNDKLYIANLGDSQGLFIKKFDKTQKEKQESAAVKANTSSDYQDHYNIYQYTPSIFCKIICI